MTIIMNNDDIPKKDSKEIRNTVSSYSHTHTDTCARITQPQYLFELNIYCDSCWRVAFWPKHSHIHTDSNDLTTIRPNRVLCSMSVSVLPVQRSPWALRCFICTHGKDIASFKTNIHYTYLTYILIYTKIPSCKCNEKERKNDQKYLQRQQ